MERLRDAGGCWPEEGAEALIATGRATAQSDATELREEAEPLPEAADEARRLPASWGRPMEHSGAQLASERVTARGAMRVLEGGGGAEGRTAAGRGSGEGGAAGGGTRGGCMEGGGGGGSAEGGCMEGATAASEAGRTWGAGLARVRHLSGKEAGGAGTTVDRRMRGMMSWTGMGGCPGSVMLAGGGVEAVLATTTRMVSMHGPARHCSRAA